MIKISKGKLKKKYKKKNNDVHPHKNRPEQLGCYVVLIKATSVFYSSTHFPLLCNWKLAKLCQKPNLPLLHVGQNLRRTFLTVYETSGHHGACKMSNSASSAILRIHDHEFQSQSVKTLAGKPTIDPCWEAYSPHSTHERQLLRHTWRHSFSSQVCWGTGDLKHQNSHDCHDLHALAVQKLNKTIFISFFADFNGHKSFSKSLFLHLRDDSSLTFA